MQDFAKYLDDMEKQVLEQDKLIRDKTEHAIRMAEEAGAPQAVLPNAMLGASAGLSSQVQASAQVPAPAPASPATLSSLRPSARPPRSPKARLDPEEAEYQRRIQSLASKLGQTGAGLPGAAGGAPAAVVAQLGQDAELTYLRARVQALVDTVNELNGEVHESTRREGEARADLVAAQAERDRLRKALAASTRHAEKLGGQLESAENRLAVEAEARGQLQGDIAKAEKLKRVSMSVVSTKERQLADVVDSVERYKAQLREAMERERGLRDEMDAFRATNTQETRRACRERDELLAIVKKQQQLIDVLQRQKLHLQGALGLGLTEEEFSRVLDAQ